MMLQQQLIPVTAATAVAVAVAIPRTLVLHPHPSSSKSPLLVCRRHHTLGVSSSSSSFSSLGNDGGGYSFDDDDDDDDTPPPSPSSSSSTSFLVGGGGRKEIEEEERAKAIEAVSEMLLHQHVGLSPEVSFDIASNSPNYIHFLLHDHLDLTTNTTTTTTPRGGGVDFKKKVFEVALEKDEKGMIPFFESLGLSLPTSMYLARSPHLSSLSLPLLLPKVKYLKEIFFSAGSSGDGAVVGQKATHMLMHLSIPTDDDLQHSLSFFEKIQARHGGLELLGSGDVSFRYLIESFPHLLSIPTKSRVGPMLKFLEDSGVPKGCMTNVLLLFPSIIFSDIEKDVKPRLLAFKKVNAADKEFGKMLVKYPWIVSTSIQKNYMEVLSYFHKEKVPEDSIQRAIRRWPPLLGCSVSKLKFMVERFRELGVSNKKLGQVIATSPQLLMRKPREFRQVVSCLQDLGLDEESVGRILGRCPKIFGANLERTLKKKVAFLIEIGVSRIHLPRVIRKYPELLILDIDKGMVPRMKYLMKMGLSTRNVVSMVGRFSPLVGYSIEGVLRPKIEFLVKTMGKPIKEVVGYPRYFSYCLEKKIKRRYWVVKSCSSSSSKGECSLQEMLAKNDEEFAAEYL